MCLPLRALISRRYFDRQAGPSPSARGARCAVGRCRRDADGGLVSHAFPPRSHLRRVPRWHQSVAVAVVHPPCPGGVEKRRSDRERSLGWSLRYVEAMAARHRRRCIRSPAAGSPAVGPSISLLTVAGFRVFVCIGVAPGERCSARCEWSGTTVGCPGCGATRRNCMQLSVAHYGWYRLWLLLLHGLLLSTDCRAPLLFWAVVSSCVWCLCGCGRRAPLCVHFFFPLFDLTVADG